ncbi:MAG TPA: hypothetical protein VHZ78_08455 [Rhizomicrobium sp.]|jgi:hypothetical protein|nr:hypothetical protein [Rhizomicrobium sp.]
MSAVGIANACPSRVISAHADYRHADFHFPRTQSLNSRDAPWERRLKPLRSWSEIGAYGAVALAATVLLTACV